MELKIILIVYLSMCLVHVLSQDQDADIDALLDEFFGTTTSTKNQGASSTTSNTLSVTNTWSATSTLSAPNTLSTPKTTSQNASCECVPYYLCKNSTIITNGEGFLDARNNDNLCESYFDFCCNLPSVVKEPITPSPSSSEDRQGCGWHNPGSPGIRFQTENNEAQYAEFPWMVAVLTEEKSLENPEVIKANPGQLDVYRCGGALIHPRAVITAAHCISKFRNQTLKIRAGEWDTQITTEIYPFQDRYVESVTIHPHFHSGVLYNDIAILFLEKPFDREYNVDTICLPPQGSVRGTSGIYTPDCFVSGWGKDQYGEKGRYQVILKKFALPIVGKDKCQEELRKTRLGQHFMLHRSFMCAGGKKNHDVCTGDGGSPLVCPIPGQPERYEQVGIVAWGIGCLDDIPGVYVDVGMFRDWIDEQMTYKNLELTAYRP